MFNQRFRFKFHCLLGALLLLSNSINAAEMDREFINLVQHKDDTYLIASLFRNVNPVDRPLIKVEGEFRGGNNSKAVQLLRQYYQYMLDGEPKKAASLFYAPDGSKERFINGLLGMPDRYAGYQMLERVDFLNSYGWGPFEIYEVKLSGSKVGSLQWREAVLCGKQQCYLTNQIDEPDSEVNKIASLRNMLQRNTNKQKQLADKFKQLPLKTFFLPNEAMSYANLQNTQYPVTFAFTMVPIDPLVIPLSKPLKLPQKMTFNGANSAVLVNLISELQSLEPLVTAKTLDELQKDSAQKDQVMARYNEVVNKYIGQRSSTFFHLFSLFKDEKTKEEVFRREWYHPVAAIQRISHWTKITLVGYIPQDGNKIALYFQPTSQIENGDETIEPLQGIVLSVSGQNTNVLLPDFKNNAAQPINFALEAPVLNELGKKYAKEPTFIYPLKP